ncbi:hypothetical protein ACUXCC_001437 [Cytobacillus horneckiae]|uniref:hypothetical protein n=1 Tax=Cytobacillus horneckiae TaxID=549687 RepID=UPI0019D2366F|nr:hypothetical protein [Cytobacillus horneckiae]MBN6885799.1 hypothetical protein [Cytobacillus horneckiae]
MWFWLAVLLGPIIIVALIEESIQFILRRFVGNSPAKAEKRRSKIRNIFKRSSVS